MADNVVSIGESMDEIIFGTGFGCATHIVAGPDGLLNIASLSHGVIYRIVPKSMLTDKTQYLAYAAIAAIVIASVIYLKRKVVLQKGKAG